MKNNKRVKKGYKTNANQWDENYYNKQSQKAKQDIQSDHNSIIITDNMLESIHPKISSLINQKSLSKKDWLDCVLASRDLELIGEDTHINGYL